MSNEKTTETIEMHNVHPIPKMKIFSSPDKYEIEGWNELNAWGVRNDKTWARMSLELLGSRYKEADRLKLLCAALLMEKHGQLWS